MTNCFAIICSGLIIFNGLTNPSLFDRIMNYLMILSLSLSISFPLHFSVSLLEANYLHIGHATDVSCIIPNGVSDIFPNVTRLSRLQLIN